MLSPNVFDLFAPCPSINDVFTMYSMSASNDVSHFIPCRPHAEVAMRHVECPVQCVVLDIRDPHRFLAVSVHCLLRGGSNCVFLWRRFHRDPSRNVLFSGAGLLISDFTWFSLRCDPPSAVWSRRAWVSCTVFVCTVSRHRAFVTNVILAARTSRVLGGSCPHFSRYVARAGVLVGACGDAGLCTWCWWSSVGNWSVWSCFVSKRIFFWVSDSGWQTTLVLFCMPLTPGSLVACRSTASGSARLILSSAAASRVDPAESPCNRLSVLFRHASLWACCRPCPVLMYQHPRTTFTDATSFEVWSANVGPRNFVSHQHFSRERGTISAGLSIPTWMSNALSPPSGDHGTARIPSIRSESHLSDSGILLTDGIAVPTFLLSLACPAYTRSPLRIPGSVWCPFSLAACAPSSFRRCRCHTCSSGTRQIPPASKVSLRRAGPWSQYDTPARPSVFRPGRPRVPLHARWSHWTGFHPLVVSPGRSGFHLGELARFPSTMPQSLARRRTWAWLCCAQAGRWTSLLSFAIWETAFLFLEPASPTSSWVSVHGWPAQDSLVLQLPFLPGTHKPLTRGTLLPNGPEHPISCVASSQHVASRRTGTMICMVDVCHVLLVFMGSRLAWVTSVPHLRTPFQSLFTLNALLHSDRLLQRSPNCGLTVSVRLDLSSTLTPPVIKNFVYCSPT